ncbi:MAG: alpha/beta hydrolase [Pyrinomonadaceae bacterium]|nr:alpha/beta hydrolase [Pyrinomonadaceae bacterium]
MRKLALTLLTLFILPVITAFAHVGSPPITQHSALSTQYLELNTQYSELSTQYSELNTQHSVVGTWLGVLEVQGFKLRLVLKVTQLTDGKLAAKMDSLDQAANDLPIDTITFDNGVLRFEARALSLSYEGKLNDAGSEIAGTFKQGPGSYPLTFKRTEKVPTLSRPQDPQKPYPYNEEEVSYENTIDKVKLAGTLTLPPSKKPVPAVVLITGSGPQDRNETLLGHRPFLVLADHLTRRGIAVLRVDDRGMGGSAPGSPNATSQNYAEDVLAGVAFLKGRKEINPRQIGLVGHSEGGMIAPIAAIRSKDVAFIVMMAGIGQTGADVILMQGDLLQKASGSDAETIVQVRKAFEEIFAVLKVEKDNTTAEKKMRQAIANQMATMSEAQKKAFAPVMGTINAQMGMYVSNWFRYFLLFDPAPTLMKVQVPVLALVGEKDLQVPPKENLALIEAALKKGGNNRYTILLMPGLNHLFQTAKTGLPGEYSLIEETISPAALQTISDWILKQTTPRKRVVRRKRNQD